MYSDLIRAHSVVHERAQWTSIPPQKAELQNSFFHAEAEDTVCFAARGVSGAGRTRTTTNEKMRCERHYVGCRALLLRVEGNGDGSKDGGGGGGGFGSGSSRRSAAARQVSGSDWVFCEIQEQQQTHKCQFKSILTQHGGGRPPAVDAGSIPTRPYATCLHHLCLSCQRRLNAPKYLKTNIDSIFSSDFPSFLRNMD